MTLHGSAFFDWVEEALDPRSRAMAILGGAKYATHFDPQRPVHCARCGVVMIHNDDEAACDGAVRLNLLNVGAYVGCGLRALHEGSAS